MFSVPCVFFATISLFFTTVAYAEDNTDLLTAGATTKVSASKTLVPLDSPGGIGVRLNGYYILNASARHSESSENTKALENTKVLESPSKSTKDTKVSSDSKLSMPSEDTKTTTTESKKKPQQKIEDKPESTFQEDSSGKNESLSNESQVLIGAFTVIQQNPSPSLTHAQESYSSLAFSEKPAEVAIYNALKKIVSISCQGGVSLRELEVTLQDTLGVPVKLDERVLTGELGLDVNEPGAIQGSFSGVSARSALRRFLSNVFETPLTYVIRDETLLITDKQYAADNYLFLRIYPLPFSKDRNYISKLIKATVAPTTWDTVGGPNCVVPHHNTLLVSAPLEIHEEIEDALIGMERLAGIQHGQPCCRIHYIADEKIRQNIMDSLLETCNTILGDRSDNDAKISVNGAFITVHSKSRPFLVFSEELINSFQTYTRHHYEWCSPFINKDGIRLDGNLPLNSQSERNIVGGMGGGMGGGLGGGMF